MKVLFFHAVAATPNSAPALMGQAGDVLRPFERFLGQAIRTAKQRQVRYQLAWKPVRDLATIHISPRESVMRVPRRRPGVVLVDWPADKEPDLSVPGFVPARSRLVHFETATRTVDGLVVRTEPALEPTDRVVWCTVDSSVRHEPSPPPPRRVTDMQGRALELVTTPRAVDDDYWRLQIAGRLDDCDLVVDGEEVRAEALSSFEGLRRVADSAGRAFDVSGGSFRVEASPADGPLMGDNGVHFDWRHEGARRGCWIQLLAPETSNADDFVDPRAAFCEGDVREVWTEPRHRNDTTYRVHKVDQDRYQLRLDRYPPDDSTLYLPVDLRNLYLQRRALNQLRDAPLPHHQGLLRLCQAPRDARWSGVAPAPLADGDWRALTDASRSGTDEQRRFVSKALGTPDFAFLEGPPGSGKTTAICEIVQQLVARGERVLLCASTHVAIDNVLERLLESDTPIDAVRIGKLGKVDEKVQRTQLDARVNALLDAWRGRPSMRAFGDTERREMAERTVLMASNLTCGTTMGIVNHPVFRGRDEDLHISARPITSMPHWDVLIIDEASKTLIQEFMVPALMAKRWIIVGDVRQLPPFADRADLVANLRDLVDEQDRPLFPPDHQRACLIMFRLLRRVLDQPGMRWLIVEPPGVIAWIASELEARQIENLGVVRVVAKMAKGTNAVQTVSLAELRDGEASALYLAAADWVLVGDDMIADVASLLPANLLLAEDVLQTGGPLHESNALFSRQAWWRHRAGRLDRPYDDRKFRREPIATFTDAQACETAWLERNDLAQELAWRITRLHELRRSRNEREKEWRRDELMNLTPCATDISSPIAEIEDIGLPSILEVLQDGIGVDRATRRSALTVGLRLASKDAFDARFESLTYQHRMHPEIASFSRDIIYEGHALLDANTIASRDTKLGWDFGAFRARRVWAHVNGREKDGVNGDEIEAMKKVLRDFIAWARDKGPPERALPKVWEVACLCFYAKQEGAIANMLREVTAQRESNTRFAVHDAPVEVVCGTVDRFQGREADLVMLSMRNTHRVGFLDSPNRLNVAVTRARQQLVIFGNANYFEGCNVDELEQLTKRSPLLDDGTYRRRGSHR